MGKLFQAVIGSNFGDEGKGRTVDYLVSKADNPIVVRHNSGAQAGHTVVIGEQRHVHSHFGAGTLRGAPTLLTHRFVVNPLVFNAEWERLQQLGITPVVFVDENCVVSTPLDILLNQITEFSRGSGRHGSCGVGFGETLARHEHPFGTKLRVKNMEITEGQTHQLTHWYLTQLKAREIQVEQNYPLCHVHAALTNGSFNWETWRKAVATFKERVIITKRPEAVLAKKNVIFEGAQGLMLHQDHEYFPHVTRCRTGIEDIVEFLVRHQLTDNALKAFYCSRPYLTRHGAGPLPEELPEKPYESIVDLTNQPNDWQGSLRFAPFQPLLTDTTILHDLKRAQPHVVMNDFSWSFVLNCADQIPNFGDMLHAAELIGWGPDSSETEINRSR